MRDRIYLLLSTSIVAFCIHQGFTDDHFNEGEISVIRTGSSHHDGRLGLGEGYEEGLGVSRSAKLQALREEASDTLGRMASVMASGPRISGLSLEDVKHLAHMVRASYTGHGDQEALIHKMEDEGYKVVPIMKTSGRHGGLIFMKGKDIIISYRGTEFNEEANYLGDLATDLNGTMMSNPGGPGSIHKGFHWEFRRSDESILKAVHAHCKENGLSEDALTFTVTGHSLGAALATLLADTLLNRFDIQPENISLVTFASPRVGDTVFAEAFNSKMYNRTLRINQAGKDIVTAVGPSVMGYKHVGQAIDVNVEEMGMGEALSFQTHFMDAYVEGLNRLTLENFKVRHVEASNSQSYAGYIAALPGYAVGGLIGGTLTFLNYLDPTSYAPFAQGLDYDGNLPERKRAREEALALLKPRIQDFALVNQELAEALGRRDDTETVLALRYQQVKALRAIGEVMHTLENHRLVAKAMTREQKKILNEVKPLYASFEKHLQEVETQAARVDQLVASNEQTLSAYEVIKEAYERQENGLDARKKRGNKDLKKAHKDYEKQQNNLEDARTKLEKSVRKLDIAKDKLAAAIHKHAALH